MRRRSSVIRSTEGTSSKANAAELAAIDALLRSFFPFFFFFVFIFLGFLFLCISLTDFPKEDGFRVKQRF